MTEGEAVTGRLPTFEDVAAASRRIAPHAVRTPLIAHPALDAHVGARVLLKAESLQRVGAFKFRGALNAIGMVDRARHPGGVVACSSGNHAQGVAAAARLCGLPSAIVMPADAPALKIARTKAFGGEVVLYDRVNEDRDAIALALCAERQAAMIHPFDDPLVIAGQGTAGLELMDEAQARGLTPDAVLAPCSGGGLVTGVATAVKHAAPATEVFAVEPAGFDDMARSLASGRHERNARMSGSICDALQAPSPGRITFELARRLLAGSLVVTDEEASAAVRFAFHELKLVLEPGGAAALAAVLAGRLPVKGRTVAVVLSGGNVDPALFASIIGG
jgi:threonine dehydratase